MSEKKKHLKPLIEGVETLSLGISMVVAVLLGVLIGFGLKYLFHQEWLFWIGVAIGIMAAILNIYKVSSKQYREFEKMSKSPKYQAKRYLNDDEDDDEDEYDGTKKY